MGYRHIDTASLYGSETATGEALAEAFDSGFVRREEMFITSKLWCSEVDDVLSAIKEEFEVLIFYGGFKSKCLLYPLLFMVVLGLISWLNTDF